MGWYDANKGHLEVNWHYGERSTTHNGHDYDTNPLLHSNRRGCETADAVTPGKSFGGENKVLHIEQRNERAFTPEISPLA